MSRTAIAIRHVAFEDVGIWREILVEEGYALAYVEAGVDNLAAEDVQSADLLIVLGGPIGVYQTEAYPFLADEVATIRRRLESGTPILGVCLGAQLMTAALGGRVAPGPAREIGYAPVELTEAGRASPLARLEHVPVLHWHGDNCDLPPGAERLASTPSCPVQAFRVGRAALGLQFHVEADPRRIEPWLIGHSAELAQGRGRSARHPRRRGAPRRGDLGGGPRDPVRLARAAAR